MVWNVAWRAADDPLCRVRRLFYYAGVLQQQAARVLERVCVQQGCNTSLDVKLISDWSPCTCAFAACLQLSFYHSRLNTTAPNSDRAKMPPRIRMPRKPSLFAAFFTRLDRGPRGLCETNLGSQSFLSRTSAHVALFALAQSLLSLCPGLLTFACASCTTAC